MGTPNFRPYEAADRERCLAVFDANCPAFFAPNERDDYAAFVDSGGDGYRVCEAGGEIAGAFGLSVVDASTKRLDWIMIDPEAKGRGIGKAIMQQVLDDCQSSAATTLKIAASHKSAAFFERFGANAVRTTRDGWGPGMHRVDMRLEIPAA